MFHMSSLFYAFIITPLKYEIYKTSVKIISFMYPESVHAGLISRASCRQWDYSKYCTIIQKYSIWNSTFLRDLDLVLLHLHRFGCSRLCLVVIVGAAGNS